MKKLSEKKWYNGAVIACIGIVIYVVLANLGPVTAAVRRFLGYFRPVLLGAVFAYILNSIAKFFYYKPFRKMKAGKARWTISVILAVVLTLLVFNLLLGILIPQLVKSIGMFLDSFDRYLSAMIKWMEASLPGNVFDLHFLEARAQNAMNSISSLLDENAPQIVSIAADYGKNLLSWIIALILALYMLIDKNRIMRGVWRLVNVSFRKETCEKIMDFSLRCDTIMTSYLGRSLLDALIISAVNAVFMLICGMRYVGLITTAVGVTNLVPTFGPFIGAGFGALVLLMVNPQHALIFLVFCVAIQALDFYLIKPKLFSGCLGVSGLLILSAVVVLGNMFGVLGVLLSIPAAAVLSFVYNDYFMPSMEKRKQEREGTAAAVPADPAKTAETSEKKYTA